ncbi:BREX system P-loop protein BrxC [Sulfurimonas sediminis]|uniref:BREX system P-loop protein BrxC n=1 Tax=Sulfurimonas sediminis TaxID=2590020 RepID=A0A7M1B3G6_9BACT|nr:BREX system P-loop protein BrxC [Sulfurimonas sediminis]QOP44195.1 BREX system P-loop protein BrxC [Sulfurimonas sediminis]
MIEKLFKKDIHRNIEGVVKADNTTDEAVFNEVDEYVITNDLNKKLDEFFGEYSATIGKSTQNIGVWISGHFGSGKSHLLKILSYILTNKREHSDLIGELFLEKIDTDDFELKANIEKALVTPSETILFNIDQKSDIGSKNQDDAILGVFMKVFNEMRGYYPKFGYIAKFESDLDKRGKFDSFKAKFQELSGESWESGRETIFLESDNLAKALSSVDDISQESAKDLIDRYEENYSLSIEEFANEVKEYIQTKEKDFRLVFFVDEVGQYIGDNTKLMLNLQTIVETLATVCNGQAWVIVTSQSAVDMLVNANSQMQNDFSKIMGRFKVKLNLTSQNANEVIQKRLLEKTDGGNSDLGVIYNKVKNSLSSIIHFSDRSRQYQNYKDGEHFALVYPFVPYQMDLFQSCITGLSAHSVFQGKHQSTGERSMLDVVQNIAKRISSETIGAIATFDMFFDGLSSIIRGDVQTQIQKATDTLEPFESKVLKTLFMIKYVKEFTPNIDNITTLLVGTIIDIDISDLKKQVQSALNTLINQTYIQKVGEQYEFLTDVEKDIEKEIKSTDVENSEIVSVLVSWIYDDIIKINKIRYAPNKQNYPFARKLDDTIVKGREEELVLNIITPLNSQDYDEERLIHKSLADSGLILALPGSYDFSSDLELWVKTNKYIPQKQGGGVSDNEKNLLFNKSNDNNKRREKLQNNLKDFISEAKIYHNGKVLEITTKDVKTKIENAFETLITSTYTYIGLLPKVYEERDISVVLNQSDDLLTGSDDALSPAEQEMYTYIRRQKASHKTLTISDLLEYFSVRPYGWYQNAILTQIASMYMKQKVDLKQNSTPLNKKEILAALTNNRQFNTIVAPRVEVDANKIKKTKETLTELYPNASFNSTSTREIYDVCQSETTKLISACRNFMNLNYPFNDVFQEIIDVLTPLEKLTTDTLFDEIPNMEDDLLDAKDDLIDPVMEFMNGDKRKIYDSVKKFIDENSNNLRYIDSPQKAVIETLLTLEKPYNGNTIPKAKQALKDVEEWLQPLIEQTRAEAITKIEAVIKELQENENFEKIPREDRYKVIRPRQELIETIKHTSSIDTIKQRSNADALADELNRGLEKIFELIPQDVIVPPKQDTVRIAKLTPRNKLTLKNSDDVNEYIEKLKENLLNEIGNGKQVLL